MSFARGMGWGAVALVAVLGLGQPAAAAGWSNDDPLKVYDNGVAQGAAYGHDYNDGDGRAMSTAWYRDLRPGGDPVRVETRGRIDICEIQSWSNDPCSAKIVETFDY